MARKKELIYLDSCVLLDYISFKEGFAEVNINRKFDISQIDESKVEIFLSYINIIEITEHLKDNIACKKAIEEGYSYFDLKKNILEGIEIGEKDLKDIDNKIKKYLLDLPNIITSKEEGINAEETKKLISICNTYSIFFIDALHFLIADKQGCNIFVTSDNALIKGIKGLIKDSNSTKSIEVKSSIEFKNSIFPNLKKTST